MDRPTKTVATVGGATAERVLVVPPDRFRPGGKHTLAPRRLLAGGSAINQACRLLAAGVDVVPIVPVARDACGVVVEQALRDAAGRGGSSAHLDRLFVPGEGLLTPFTTITSIGSERTIYTEFDDAMFAPFEHHLDAQLEECGPDHKPDVLLLGHLHADRERPPGRAGAMTLRTVARARELSVPTVVNLGSSQYRRGWQAFEPVLRDIECFQLDIGEMRSFVGDAVRGPTLPEVLAWFRDRCTVVVTMERMGAVGQLRGSSRIVLTWPYEISAGDTTGAGDAFAAGMVASMLDTPLSDDLALMRAMDRGGLFAAHACLTPGGADQCPTAADLDAFRAQNTRVLDTEVTSLQHAGKLLRLLDQAFPERR